MSERQGTKKNSRAPLSGAPYDVVRVEPCPGFRLRVEFADGTRGSVELEAFLFQPKPGVFEPLRNPARFAEAYAHPDGYVAWPGGQDLASDAMYNDIRKARRRTRT
jgi:hypothetical protein